MNTLQGIFDTGRSTSKRNFIQENVRQLRTMRKCRRNKDIKVDLPKRSNKFQHVSAKVPAHVTPSIASKERETQSQTVMRARSSDVPTRSSITSRLPPVQSAGPQNSQPGQRLPTKSALSRKSRIYPFSNDNHSSAFEVDASKRQLKHSAAASQKTANSITKSLSAMSLSSSLDVTKEGSDIVHRTVSENSISIEPIRSVGCQTVAPEDVDGMFNEGVIKYPSTCHLEALRMESSCKSSRPPTRDSTQQTETTSLQLPLLVSEVNTTRPSPIPLMENVMSNPALQNVQIIQPVHEQLLHRFKGTSTGGNNLKSTLTHITNTPKKGRNRERPRNGLHNQTSEFDTAPPRSYEFSDPTCPPGHVPLPEAERLETLRILQKSYEDHIRQLNLLPVKTDTLKMRLRKVDIEKQLSKLEEGIKVFSRPKVFVKIGA